MRAPLATVFIAGGVLLWQAPAAQPEPVLDEFVAGYTYTTSEGFTEYQPGDLPLILLAGHGGQQRPASIPDRTSGVTSNDLATQELAREISDAILERTGGKPFLIVNHLHRSKLDVNREIGEGAQGNPAARQAWQAFHDFVAIASDQVTRRFGAGLLLDVHGQSHPEGWIELGYGLSAQTLELADAELDAEPHPQRSTLRALLLRRQASLAELIRGEASPGAALSDDYDVVPSPAIPSPGGGNYFSGGFNVRTYGSGGGGSIDAIQLEFPRFLRQDPDDRRRLADDVARTAIRFLEQHYPAVYRGLLPLSLAGGELRGLALVNISDGPAAIFLDAFPDPGQDPPFSLAQALVLGSTVQLARLDQELFGDSIRQRSGWIEFTGSADVSGLFQLGALDLGRMEGGLLSAAVSTHHFLGLPGSLTPPGDSQTTALMLINPNAFDIEVLLRLHHAGGTADRVVELAPKRSFEGALSSLFDTDEAVDARLLEVIAEPGPIGAWGLITAGEAETQVQLRPLTGDASLYGPQFAVLDGIASRLYLYNTAADAVDVQIDLLPESGFEASRWQVRIGPFERVSLDGRQGFGLQQWVGSVMVSSSGPGVGGQVLLSEPGRLDFATLPALSAGVGDEHVFAHLASSSLFMTGLAMLNVTDDDILVEVEAYRPDGVLIGAARFELAGGSRVSRLITEWIAETTGHLAGSIRVRAGGPIAAQQFFGSFADGRLQMLSTVQGRIVAAAR